MDPTKLLEADHRQVEALLARIRGAPPGERQTLVDELAAAVRGHLDLEETVLYPAMEDVTGPDTVQEAVTEHELTRKGLEEVVRLAPDAPGFAAALEIVKTGIGHHVEEEESEVFPLLRRDGAEVLAGIEAGFLARRVELGLPSDPGTIAAAHTKRELVEAAREQDIRGAASMSKSELAEQLMLDG